MLPVPPLPVLPLPVPVTSWPAVRFTDATVPAMVDVSEASFRLVCAVESEDSAEVTDAWSESIVLWDGLVAASSLERRSSAEVSCACAALTSSESAVVSTVASTCPAVTLCPALTSTAVTVPETAKLRFAWLAGSSVPELVTVCWIVPVVTGTVTVVTERPPGVDEPDVSQRGSATAAATRTTTAATMGQRYRRQADGCSGARTFSSSSGSSWVRSTGLPVPTVDSVRTMVRVQPNDVTTSRIPAVSPLGL